MRCAPSVRKQKPHRDVEELPRRVHRDALRPVEVRVCRRAVAEACGAGAEGEEELALGRGEGSRTVGKRMVQEEERMRLAADETERECSSVAMIGCSGIKSG